MLVYAVVLILVMLATNSPILKNLWALVMQIPFMQTLADKLTAVKKKMFKKSRKAGDEA